MKAVWWLLLTSNTFRLHSHQRSIRAILQELFTARRHGVLRLDGGHPFRHSSLAGAFDGCESVSLLRPEPVNIKTFSERPCGPCARVSPTFGWSGDDIITAIVEHAIRIPTAIQIPLPRVTCPIALVALALSSSVRPWQHPTSTPIPVTRPISPCITLIALRGYANANIVLRATCRSVRNARRLGTCAGGLATTAGSWHLHPA